MPLGCLGNVRIIHREGTAHFNRFLEKLARTTRRIEE
jgi:hypothetical protein